MEAENARLVDESKNKPKADLSSDRNWMSSFGSNPGMGGGRLGTASG